jgi:hypothetical protein
VHREEGKGDVKSAKIGRRMEREERGGESLRVLTNQYITIHTSQYNPNSERSIRVDITYK